MAAPLNKSIVDEERSAALTVRERKMFIVFWIFETYSGSFQKISTGPRYPESIMKLATKCQHTKITTGPSIEVRMVPSKYGMHRMKA